MQRAFHPTGFIQNLGAEINSSGQANGNLEGGKIISTQKLKSGVKSEYIADQSIILLPGFESDPVFHAEIKPKSGYQWNYILRDHLGNTRVVFADKNQDRLIRQDSLEALNEVLSLSNYSPFGLELGGSHQNLKQQFEYKFNGKQENGFSGLIDFGGRWFDKYLGRWNTIDPKAEKMVSWSPFSAFFNNPIRFTDPDGQEPTPAEAARMAAHVYGDKKDNILTGGWRVSQTNFGIRLTDKTSLKSLVYERVVDGKVTEYVYATAGSVEGRDWAENAKQPLGLSKQYHNAVENAKTLSKALSNTELNFVGHSLGGGEAALNSLVTSNEKLIGRKAFTFNAAGVGDITKIAEGSWKTRFKSEKNINAFILTTDPLNLLQNSNPIMPDVNGNRNYLLPKDLPSTYNGHSIDNIIKNFGVNPDEYKK